MSDAADLVSRISRDLKPTEVKLFVTEDDQHFADYDDAMNHTFVCKLIDALYNDSVDIDTAKEAHALYLRGEGE